MKYYKWINSTETTVEQIPYFVYTSLKTAKDHKEIGNLYSFEGIDPIVLKQIIPTALLTIKGQPVELSQQQITNTLNYFNDKPTDHLLQKFGYGDLLLIRSILPYVHAIKTESQDKAFYAQPVKLHKEI